MSCRAAVSVAVLTLAVLAGCSDEDPPASLPTPTASSTPTTAPETTTTAPPTSATPTGAPTVPAAAQEQTPDGAAAFVQHWYDTLEYAESIMNSSPVRALDDGSCLSCDNFADTIDSVAADGDRLEGGKITAHNIEPNAIQGNGSSTVNTLISYTEQRIASPDGTTELLGPGEDNIQFFFTLAWRDSSWRVGEIQVIT